MKDNLLPGIKSPGCIKRHVRENIRRVMVVIDYE